MVLLLVLHCKLIAMFVPICWSNRSRTFRGYGARTHAHTHTHVLDVGYKSRGHHWHRQSDCVTHAHLLKLPVTWCDRTGSVLGIGQLCHRTQNYETCEVSGERVSTSGRWSGMSSRSSAADDVTCRAEGAASYFL